MSGEEEELRALRSDPAPPKAHRPESLTFSTDTPSDGRVLWRRVLDGCSPTRRLPILTWIRRYEAEDALSDLIAGITLGLTMIPQSIAYATIAGLPSQYGLYAAFMGSLVYVFFGTVREVSIGPTSLMSLLTLEYTSGRPPQYVVALAFASGIVELAMGAFRLGGLVCLISVPVTSAFTSATALIIIAAQAGNLLGLSGGGGGFFTTLWSVFRKLPESTPGDTTLGVVCIVLLVALQHLPRLVPSNRHRSLHRLLWYVSLSRNALIVLMAALLARHLAATPAGCPFRLSGRVEPGIPGFQWPAQDIIVGNTTVPFPQVIRELGSGLLLLPLVAVLANVAIAKAFANDGVVDATQELFALGLCNVLGSCFRAMPTTGAFTRSAVSHASGVRTPLAGLYSALLTLLALGVLTPHFRFIPRATLAAVLMTAVAPMIDLALVRRLTRLPATRADLLSWVVCFGVCLTWGVEVGLLCGMATSLIEPLRHWMLPQADRTTISGPGLAHRRIRPNPGLLYPGADRLRTLVLAEARHSDALPLVLDCERLVALDHSAAKALRELAGEVERCGTRLLLRNVQPSWIQALKLHETDDGLVFEQSA
ncbi:sodium-independent sulfate anion transporter-like [Anopheles nili]|uniref:sodium-independent sulfate anion transporter-like n=1 Tax=Anopheles nili TaxID=185578 RepID=UPI00237BA7FE|nr:sodium-independent sulfate anion transporter-like [Anopheles nili]